MQRQLKFRAWTGQKMRPCAVSADGKAMMDFGPSNAPLMEWTGLKDRDGKEIYEGDIVRVDDEAAERFYQGKNILCVEYVTGSFKPYDFLHGGSSIVIGNLYENPELTSNN